MRAAQQAYSNTEAGLCAQLEEFCQANGLPYDCARNLLHICKSEHLAWLAGFYEQWDRVTERTVASERDKLKEENAELLDACRSALPFLKGLRDGLKAVDPDHDPRFYEQQSIDVIEALIAKHQLNGGSA